MDVCVNGAKRVLPEGATIQELLVAYNLQPVRVAVELNRDIVTKPAYATTGLKPGDKVEIVTFVGGG